MSEAWRRCCWVSVCVCVCGGGGGGRGDEWVNGIWKIVVPLEKSWSCPCLAENFSCLFSVDPTEDESLLKFLKKFFILFYFLSFSSQSNTRFIVLTTTGLKIKIKPVWRQLWLRKLFAVLWWKLNDWFRGKQINCLKLEIHWTNSGRRSKFAGNSTFFPSDVIDFSILPAQRFWRETVSLLDIMWPWSNQWGRALLGKSFQQSSFSVLLCAVDICRELSLKSQHRLANWEFVHS